MQTKLILRRTPTGQNVIKDDKNVIKDVLKGNGENQHDTHVISEEKCPKDIGKCPKAIK